MRTITHRTLVVLGAALICGIVACSAEVPTDATGTPSDARFGITSGSGNVVGTPTTENTMAADSGSTARGGVIFGSGS